MYSIGYDRADRIWGTKWAERDSDAAISRAALEREFREREQALQDKLNTQQVQYDQRLAEMQRIQSDASADSDRLRKQVADLRRRLSSGPAEASGDSWQLPAVTRAALVLSDLYGSCVGHRQELAVAADAARQRGLALEQMYDQARGQ